MQQYVVESYYYIFKYIRYIFLLFLSFCIGQANATAMQTQPYSHSPSGRRPSAPMMLMGMKKNQLHMNKSESQKSSVNNPSHNSPIHTTLPTEQTASAQNTIHKRQNVHSMPSSRLSDQPIYKAHALLTANKEAVLSSQIAGYLIELPLKEGSSFKQGDLLAKLDCTIHKLQLKKSEALLSEFLAEYKANKKLAKLDAIDKTELAKSKAKLNGAYADVEIKKQQVKFCAIRAPFNGKLIKISANKYENVKQNQPLIEVLDNDNFFVELIVPSAWLGWLRPNDHFSLKIRETGRIYQAHIEKILPKIDSVSQSVHVFGKLETTDNHLISGMSGDAFFSPPKQSAQNNLQS